VSAAGAVILDHRQSRAWGDRCRQPRPCRWRPEQQPCRGISGASRVPADPWRCCASWPLDRIPGH